MSKPSKFTLTAAQLTEIEYAMLNDSRDYVRRRTKAIWLKHHGHNAQAIANECGAASRVSVYSWFDAYQTGGIDALCRPNRRQDDAGLHAALSEFGVDLPLTYTETLRDRVEEKTGMTFTSEQFDDIILALDGRWLYDPEDQALITRIPLVGDSDVYWRERLSPGEESAAD
jgi:transposase